MFKRKKKEPHIWGPTNLREAAEKMQEIIDDDPHTTSNQIERKNIFRILIALIDRVEELESRVLR